VSTVENSFKEALKDLMDALGKLKILCIILYGSRAKGFEKPSSDYDLLVVTEKTPENPLERISLTSGITGEAILKYGIRVSVTLLNRKEALEEALTPSPLMQNLLIGYKILYERDGFISKLLEHVKKKANLIYVERGRRWDLRKAI